MSDEAVAIQKMIVTEWHKIIPYTDDMEKAAKVMLRNLDVAFTRTGFESKRESDGSLRLQCNELVAPTIDDVPVVMRVSYESELGWVLSWRKGEKRLLDEGSDIVAEVPFDPVQGRFVNLAGNDGGPALAKGIMQEFGKMRASRTTQT